MSNRTRKVCHEFLENSNPCFSGAVALTFDFMEDTFYKWLVESVIGLILIGFGLSLFGQSVIYKSKGESVKKWFLWGTLSLIVINAGICVFGDAVKTRMMYERTETQGGKIVI